jgi:hypothetical protein
VIGDWNAFEKKKIDTSGNNSSANRQASDNVLWKNADMLQSIARETFLQREAG